MTAPRLPIRPATQKQRGDIREDGVILKRHETTLTFDRETRHDSVEPRRLPVHHLRDDLRVTGESLEPHATSHAAGRAAEGLELVGDHPTSASYRGHLVSTYAERALLAAVS